MLNENLKKVLFEMGYEGGFELGELVIDVQPYLRTLSYQDNGSWAAANSACMVGIINGAASPEDAVALLWIRTAISFKGQIKKSGRRKVKESKIKFKGEPWGKLPTK